MKWISFSRLRVPLAVVHHDEVFVRIGGKQTYLRRAADDEGEVLDVSGPISPK